MSETDLVADGEFLDTEKIIRLVLSAAGLPASGGKSDGEIRARLLAHGGGSSVETLFLVQRRRGLFRTEVDIRPVGRERDRTVH